MYKCTGLLICLAAMVGCGGQVDLSCDDPEPYQAAALGETVKSPEDLDDLDPRRQMPLPEASPAPPRPAGSKCLDMPPLIDPGS